MPPDFTRFNSRAGLLTCQTHDYYGDRLVDVMPALGTHFPMPDWQFGSTCSRRCPKALFREHRWRDDVVTLGEVPAEFVSKATEGIWDRPWPAQMNKLLWEGGHDLILSIGQVVPHEVIGMANYNKNIFVGTGGVRGINESHYIGAVYGMERMMGVGDTPLRRILNYAQDHFCQHLPLVYVLDRRRHATNARAVGLPRPVHRRRRRVLLSERATVVQSQLRRSSTSRCTRCVVYLDPEKFQSTWLGNKSIYRTRMAIADGGELVDPGPRRANVRRGSARSTA